MAMRGYRFTEVSVASTVGLGALGEVAQLRQLLSSRLDVYRLPGLLGSNY